MVGDGRKRAAAMVRSRSRQALGADGLKNGLTGELVLFSLFNLFSQADTCEKDD
jgi:hypothetical protein